MRRQQFAAAVLSAVILSWGPVSIRAASAGSGDFDGNKGDFSNVQRFLETAKDVPAAAPSISAQAYPCDPARTYEGGPCDPSGGLGYRLPRGVAAARRICEQLFLDGDKASCMRRIGRARYFSVDAAEVCRGLYLDRDKIKCLGRIADRFLAPDVVRVCGRMVLDSDKIQCLRDAPR